MESSILGHMSFNYKDILIDEISLEGLEGITLPMLWKRVEYRISATLTDKLKSRLWNFIMNYDGIQLYVLPEPIPDIEIIDRFEYIHENSGYLDDPLECFDGPYEFCPIDKEYGSCQNYNKRILLEKNQIKETTCSELETQYDHSLIMVASLEDRWQALAPHIPITYLNNLTQPQYCILELVGRGRHNGQTTTGKTNLMRISKDPKILFYNRKCLQDNDLIRVHTITLNMCEKGTKSLLLRLKRFHEQTLKSMPRHGKIRNLVDHLLTKPNFCDRTDEMFKKGLLTSKESKKLYKKVNIFNFEDKEVSMPSPSTSQTKLVKRKFISLSNLVDEPSHSDSDEEKPTLKCQYKIGVGMMRQAYDLFLEAGLKGLTYMDVAQLLGVRFYTCRAICRILKTSNLVREFLEDKGRQRKARYIAVAATRKMDIKYAKERQKLLNYLDHSKEARKRACESTADDQNETPIKQMKVDNNENKDQRDTGNTNGNDDCLNSEKLDITEVKVLEGVQNPSTKPFLSNKDNLTLRQLKYANGILKILNDKLCISGYTTLSNMVAKEINEPAMVSKSMKAFIQKLVSDGYIKIYNVKWPGPEQRFSKLICAATVKSTDPVILAKCKEIRLKSITKKTENKPKTKPTYQRSLWWTSWPRYARLQKLHECLTNFAYFTPSETETRTFPMGFVLIADFIPSLTVQFVVSNTSRLSLRNDNCPKITADMLHRKMGELSKDVYETFLKTNSFKTTIKENLRVLATLGLIQLVYYSSIPSPDQQNSSLFSYMVYVNRNAKILDTRGEWPRPNVDKNELERAFVFESPADVENFWEQVFNISINTSVKVANRSKNTKPMPPVRLQNEVNNFDNGERYGDESGPCGYDSFYVLELPWLWRSMYPKTKKRVPKKVISQQTKPKKVEVKTAKKIVKKVPSWQPVKQPPITIPRMRKSAGIAWSKNEDMIIMICKIATSITSPNPQVGCLRVRDFVARDLLSMHDPRKTIKLCHRRAKALNEDTTVVHNMEFITNYLRRNRKLMQKYDSLLKKIRLRHSTNLTRYINVARVAMLELVWSISQIIQSKAYTSKIGCIAKSYEELIENYELTYSTANHQQNSFKLIDNMTLKEAIIMSVMLSFKYTITTALSKRIYSVFKIYPEITLRSVFEQLRKCGVLASKKNSADAALARQNLQDIVHLHYKISNFYQRRWNSRLNQSFADTLATLVETGLTESNIKGSPEINCFMCELQAFGLLDVICATVPVITGDCGTNILQEENMNSIDIETKFKLKSGTLAWKNKMKVDKLSDCFESVLPKSKECFKTLITSYMMSDEKLETNDEIITYLTAKGERGATFVELKDAFNYTTQHLKDKLRNLEASKFIKRLGYYENVVILTEFKQSWTIIIDKDHVVPAPWVTLDKEIRLEVFFKWAGVVMNKIYENPGCPINYLTDVCEFLSSRHIQDVCEVLEQCECITLKNVIKQDIDLFSDDADEPEFEEYNEYADFSLMLTFPTMNSLTKFSYIRKKMLETQNPYLIMDIKI